MLVWSLRSKPTNTPTPEPPEEISEKHETAHRLVITGVYEA